MSVLITGGNGHVSSWIAYMLAKKGRKVISFDVNPTPPPILDSVRDNIDFFRGDVLDLARKYSHLESDIHMGPGHFSKRPEALDNSLAKEALGYQAQYSIEDGIKAYASWFKKLRTERI